MSDDEKPKKDPEVKQKFVVRTPTDVQRIKLQKLMANPTKEIIIQPLQTRKSSDPSGAVPSFVRNVMGSSAGAGSGEFHVYRHLRRKEFARQKQIEQKSKLEEMDEAFANKLLQNKLNAEIRTAKKRAKRLKKKQKAKQRRLNPKPTSGNEKTESSDDESDEEDDDAEKPAADTDDTSEGKDDAEKPETNTSDGDEAENEEIVGPMPRDAGNDQKDKQEVDNDGDGKDEEDDSDGRKQQENSEGQDSS